MKQRLPRWLSGDESTCQSRRPRRLGFDPWVRKTPWKRKRQPTPVFLPGESHGQQSLVGYSPWGHKESDMIEFGERRERRLLSFVSGGTMIAWDKVVADTERSFAQGLVGRKEKSGSLAVFKESDGLRNLSWMWRKVERERNRWGRWRGQWIECRDGDKTEVPEDCWAVERRF